jgi:ABC-type nitrate/sulfonate/bicarbonate transport system permease component
MRISLALSITLVIVVEMLVGDKGLGHRIIEAERTFRFSEMYGIILLIGVLGYFANRAFLSMTRVFIGWHLASHESKELI